MIRCDLIRTQIRYYEFVAASLEATPLTLSNSLLNRVQIFGKSSQIAGSVDIFTI